MKLLSTVIILFCLLLATSPLLSTSEALSIQKGEEAPDFTLRSLDGTLTSLSDIKDTVLVIIYFRLDQKQSMVALKEIKDIRSTYARDELHILAISAESEKREDIIRSMKDLGITFPVLLDSERDVYGRYGVRVYPSTIVVDKYGKIASSMPGHVLSYKVRLDGIIQYVMGRINEKELQEMISPEKKRPDVKALYAHRMYNLALKFTESRLYDQAITFAKRAIEAKPDIADSHTLLGYLYIDAGEMDKAIKEFERSVDIDPSSHDAKTGLGSVLIDKHEYDRAIEVLNEALFLNPHPERTLYELGRAHEMKEDADSASDMYRKSMEKIMGSRILPSNTGHCR